MRHVEQVAGLGNGHDRNLEGASMSSAGSADVFAVAPSPRIRRRSPVESSGQAERVPSLGPPPPPGEREAPRTTLATTQAVRQARHERQQRFVRPPAAPVVTARMTSDAQGHDYQAIARSAVASTEAPRAQSSGVLYSAGLCERPSMLGTKSIAVGMRVPIV